MTFKFSILAAILALAVVSAQAQVGFDTVYGSRTVVITPPVNFVAGTSASNIIDRTPFLGVGQVTIFANTNAVTTGSLTAQVFTSPDLTNWTALANYALVSSTTAFNFTNGYYGGTNLIATNNVLLPGTLTTPTAATSSYAAIPYLAKLAWTNNGSITVSKGGVWLLGFNVNDQARYIDVQWTPSATTGTNFSGSAIFTGVPIYPAAD